jgi:hypothetical protein
MAVTNPNLSYPKPRGVQTKIVPIARTDSSTLKCIIPKDSIIVDVEVFQNVDAATAAGSFVLGWAGTTTGVLASFSMATTKVGLVKAGVSMGTGVFARLDSDKAIISTYTVGSSTAGGTGFVKISYFTPGPGEAVDD